MAGKSVANNLQQIMTQIHAAEARFGRVRGDVKLVAVSKTKSLTLIDEAAIAGHQLFAENYVQEVMEKISARPNLEWHYIGTLQTNKVKEIIGRVALIHSVDRLKLALEISKEAAKKSVTQDILLQMHIGNEASKHGFSNEELTAQFKQISELPGLRIRGLMALPPLSDDESVSRGYFKNVQEMHNTLKKMLPEDKTVSFSLLSMGTTNDFVSAIAEGATHVRIGTAIFGEREAKQ